MFFIPYKNFLLKFAKDEKLSVTKSTCLSCIFAKSKQNSIAFIGNPA
jgi:hypothetical protein